MNNKYSKVLTGVLIVVIIAVIGLLSFLAYDVFHKHTIEEETSDAVSKFENKIRPTVEPTNVIGNNVEPNVNLNEILGNTTTEEPSGSGNEGGGSNTSVKYKGYDVIGTIEIPKTKVKSPIIKQEDVSTDSLKVAICNLYGELNKTGDNAVLVGHNYRNGTFFSNNKKLQKGDKIYITDLSGNKVTYVITNKYETGTGDFDYATRKIEKDTREISLSTCTDDSKMRLIIWAKEQK